MNMLDKAKGYVQGARNVAAAAAGGLRAADTQRRVAAINAEQARLRAAAGQPADPAATVAASMAATRAERLAPPPPAEAGLPRRPTGPMNREVRRAGGKTVDEIVDDAAGMKRR